MVYLDDDTLLLCFPGVRRVVTQHGGLQWRPGFGTLASRCPKVKVFEWTIVNRQKE